MSKEVRIELSDEEFERLDSFKDEYGLTWKGVLVYGVLKGHIEHGM